MANNKMLIDAGHPEETRVAMVRGNRVDEFDFESEHKTQLRGNIYLAKVTRVEPSLQAAFVDYGGNRHGFLAFSEIHPDYYQIPMADRQALLEAEAEDAREAAEAEEARDSDSDADGDDETNGEEVKEAKPARKRRSRRRSKKSTDEETNASEDDAEEAAQDATESDTSTSGESESEEVSEEDDNDGTTMAADNENDDVVSEPAEASEEKPKRKRTTRKKKEPAADASDAASESDGDAAAETEEKPKRRRTSRKKKDEPVAEEVKAESSGAEAKSDETPADEEKPKRRRTPRKKKDVEAADTTNEEQPAADVAADESSDAQPADGDEETDEKKPRGRNRRSRGGRSRRGKRNDNDNRDDDDADYDTPVEEVGSQDALEEVPARRSNRRHYKIQEVIKRRQILLVQVVKEERGNKGAALTTYLSLAGRYSVLMPNTARGGGISRKITNVADRKRLKSIASGLEVPQGMGVILRTAGASRSPEEIQRDFEYLMRLWENVRTLTLESTAPCLVYEEGSLIKRSIRDLYDKDTGEILVAGDAGFREAKDFMAMLMPEHAKNVKQYKDRVPLFARMGVEAQLDAMLQPQVTLKSGGYLILDQTEALVAIDVNSGRSTRQHSIEETAVQTNLEAADEVARQLRLRDLAGLIVIDFIDMEDKRNIRAVEKRLKDALKNDRARIQVGRISHFGLMEMSRQRIRASVLESTTQTCPVCEGLGHVRSASSVALGVLRQIEENLNRNARNNLTVKVSTDTAIYMLNHKKESLSDLEERFGVSISIATDDSLGTTPCAIEKGELSNRMPAVDTAIQPDSFSEEMETVEQATPADNAEASKQQPVGNDEADEDGEPRKKRRRRRRRRGSGNGEATNENSESPSSDQDANEETTKSSKDAPKDAESDPDAAKGSEDEAKPRTRRTRKTSRKADESSDTSLEETSVSDGETEDKPKRTRRKKKVAEAETQEPTVEEAVVAEATAPVETIAEEAEDEAKPTRRTTRRKTKDESDAPVMADAIKVESTSSDETVKEKPKKGWWNRKFF